MFKFGCELLFASLHYINGGRNLEFICTCFLSLFGFGSGGKSLHYLI